MFTLLAQELWPGPGLLVSMLNSVDISDIMPKVLFLHIVLIVLIIFSVL